MTLTTTLIGVCLSALQSQAPVSAKPADLAIVVRAAQESSESAPERDKLVGKEYEGIVTIQSVRVTDGAATIAAETQPGANKPGVRVRFVTTDTDTVLNAITRGQVVRMRARFKAFSGTATAPILDFTEMTIVTDG
jgi:hypothetical protein